MDLPGEGVTPCLAPVATLLNHSAVAPNIVRYGRLAEARGCSRAGAEARPGGAGDPADDMLELRALRPCEAGHQARGPAWCLEDGQAWHAVCDFRACLVEASELACTSAWL